MSRKKEGENRGMRYHVLGSLVALALLTTTPNLQNNNSRDLETIVNKEDVRAIPSESNSLITLNSFINRNKPAERAMFESYIRLNPQKNVINTFSNMYDRIEIYTDLFNELEEKYELPKGILAGLALQESQGYPDKLAYNADGGVGLFQLQPGVGASYGMNIYGDSRRVGVDKKNGNDVKRLVDRFNNNLISLSEFDDRFNPYLSSIAAARHLHKYKKVLEQRGTYTSKLLIDSYNKGVYSKHLNEESLHVIRVENFRDQYNGLSSAAFKKNIEN